MSKNYDALDGFFAGLESDGLVPRLPVTTGEIRAATGSEVPPPESTLDIIDRIDKLTEATYVAQLPGRMAVQHELDD